jgi:hypothetical protein
MPVNLARATTRLAELVHGVPDDVLLNPTPCDIPSARSWTMSARSPRVHRGGTA